MVNSESAKLFLGSDFEFYRKTLSEAIHSEEPYLEKINNYVLGYRGKEIRPVLSLLAGRSVGKLTSTNYYCAAISEMLHTATLMHDDVADAASIRRGHLSVSAMFSPAAAVLTGDFWLSRLMGLLTSRCSPAIVSCFTETVQKMSEGELLQLDKAGKLDTTEKDYYTIIYGKTAALFVACIKSAAYAVQAHQDSIDALGVYAENIGYAFQIKDDIFDYSPSLDTGKTAGADLKERKITLPLLGALHNAPESSGHILSELRKIDNSVKMRNMDIKEEERSIIAGISDFVHTCKGLEYAQHKLDGHIGIAIDALSALPSTEEKQMLIDFAEYLGRRDR